jgi:hypothetical protein
MLIINTGRISKFTINTAGATNHSGAISENGAQVKTTNKPRDTFLPILVERVFLPLRRSVSISLMLLISRTAVAKLPAAAPPNTLKMFISRV